MGDNQSKPDHETETLDGVRYQQFIPYSDNTPPKNQNQNPKENSMFNFEVPNSERNIKSKESTLDMEEIDGVTNKLADIKLKSSSSGPEINKSSFGQGNYL